MAHYYVNDESEPNGDHEVHHEGCRGIATTDDITHVGDHPSCHGAVVAASRFFPRVNGCAHCSPECHTG